MPDFYALINAWGGTTTPSGATWTPATTASCRSSRLVSSSWPAESDSPGSSTYSPASIAKAYLTAMGITPVLERQPDFPTEILGAAMSAFYGGRAECAIAASRCR